jgi:hypothetical protein
VIPSHAPAAVMSADGTHRYFLSRHVSASKVRVAFVGLNPSTADATSDDPTIRRCRGFAAEWGAGELWMVNLFAYRSTDPAGLLRATNPIGDENDAWLEQAVSRAELVIAAWGNHGALFDRAAAVLSRFPGRFSALGVTKSGMPRHPLYIRSGSAYGPFTPSSGC